MTTEPNVKLFVLPLAATAIFEGFRTTVQLLPKLSDVREGSKDNKKLRMDVRTGEVVATVTLMAASGSVSYLAGHPAPLIGALMVAGTVIALYEWTLSTQGVDKPGDIVEQTSSGISTVAEMFA